jgi:hypothetical protein
MPGTLRGQPPLRNVLLRLSRAGSALSGILGVLPEEKLHNKQHQVQPGVGHPKDAIGGGAPVEGAVEDQTEGDVAAPQVRTNRPECSVRSEGETSPFLFEQGLAVGLGFCLLID